MPNITGELSCAKEWDYGRANGAFAQIAEANGPEDSKWANGKLVNFNASRSSSIYGTSSTVQPPTIALIPQIKF